VAFDPAIVPEPDDDARPLELQADDGYHAGEKVAAVLEAAWELLENVEPDDRRSAVLLFAFRKVAGMAGGVDGVLALLPPIQDDDRWDALLTLGVGILAELRADDAATLELEAARAAGAAWLGALLEDGGAA
jgi:hypothetical protein